MVKKLIRVREILTKQRDNKQLHECATNYRKSELKKKIKECKRYGQKYKTKDVIQNAPEHNETID